MTIQTDPNSPAIKQVKGLLSKFPTVGLLESALIGRLQQAGIDYQNDIRPLLGNPLAFGDISPSISRFGHDFLLAWVTKDAGKLSALLAKVKQLTSAGSHDGAKLYHSSSLSVAVDGPTVLLAQTQDVVVAALDRHAQNQGIAAGQYAAERAGLDSGAFIHIYGDLVPALSTATTATARQIPWVAAIRSYGASISASGTGLTFNVLLNTSGTQLTAAQLPISTGTAGPGLINGLPIQFGVLDPQQIVKFALSAVQAASPSTYAKFLSEENTIRRKAGIDISGLLGQLTGALYVNSDTHTTYARVGLADPSQVTALLTKVSAAAHANRSGTLKPVAPSIYQLASKGHNVLLGVIGNEFVVGVPPKGTTMTPQTLHSYAATPSTPLPGASGAVAFRVSLSQLLPLVLKSVPSTTAQQVLGLLGDLTGSMTATPAALTELSSIAIK
jgi:hypothetical protein